MSGGHGSNNIELRHQSLNVLSWGIQRSNKVSYFFWLLHSQVWQTSLNPQISAAEEVKHFEKTFLKMILKDILSI